MPLLLASKLQGVFAAAKPRFPKALEDCHVICIPTAANVYDEPAWLKEEMDIVRAVGASLDVFDIAGKSAQEVVAKLATVDIIYVTGGNCYYLAEQMHLCNFAEILTPFLAKGGLYVGASAGAVALCPRVDFVGQMDDPSVKTTASMHGLNLVPFLLMVHTDHPRYGPIAMQLLKEIASSETAIALTDSQALWLTGNVVEVIQA